MLKLYNTLSRKKEIFKPIKKGEVGIYSCGPTVYWFAHVGNFRSYVFADVLKRVLVYDNFKVKHIINVTDVGHLTSDADEGEDKLEKSAKKEGRTATEIGHFYFDAFLKDFRKLNLVEPMKWVWATEHIREQIDLIKILEKKGFTYRTSDGIYFDSSKVADYGKLARLRIESLKAGKRIAVGEKKNKTDFALWKFSGKPGERQQEWDSPWGLGFPGWHIECSAMASKYLGKQFDVHTGGEDHLGVHHVNEIAQSESAWEKKPWVRYWMHGAFLNLKGGKMSKSSGGIKTIGELERDGIDALAYKYFCYTAHYRKPLTWSDEAISSAVSSFKKLKNICLDLIDDGKVNMKYLKEFEKCIDDDLDMPGAVAVLWSMLRDEKANGKVGAVKKMDEVFGLGLLSENKVEVPSEVKKLAKERSLARKEKDWKRADELREKIEKLGWKIEDVGNGFELEKV
ncbi:MAG: cysteine--tRNA ligase [archaeon]